MNNHKNALTPALVALVIFLLIFEGCSTKKTNNQQSSFHSKVPQNSVKASDNQNNEERNKYRMNFYNISSDKESFADKYGNLILYDSIPYYNVLDEVFIDFCMNEDDSSTEYCNYKHMKNFRQATDNKDYIISDYKDGVCINEYKGKDKNVLIPNTLDGKKVIKIGCNIFQDEFDTYYASPFYGLNLDSITISSSIQEISYGAFSNITSSEDRICKRIYVNKNNLFYTSIDGLLYNKNASILLQIPTDYNKSLVKIAKGTKAVYSISCSNNIEISIPKSVISFGEEINESGDSDSYYTIDYNLDDMLFSDCNYNLSFSSIDIFKVTKFHVSKNNLYYSSHKGSLYNKNKTRLIVKVKK